MERFYANLWTKKLPKLEALRQAQLDVLKGSVAGGGAAGAAVATRSLGDGRAITRRRAGGSPEARCRAAK